jgi:hypothetical protein
VLVTIRTDRTQLTFARVDEVKAAAATRGYDPEPVLKGDDRLWILGQPFEISVTHLGAVNTYTVPAGFVTDGASVPYLAQVLTGWRPWDEPHRWGAIVHDWLYCCNGRLTDAAEGYRGPLPRCGKPYADLAFRATLKAVGTTRLRAAAMYWAVRLFGGHAYAIDQKTGPTVRA